MPPFLNNKTCFPSSAALHTIAHSFNAATKFGWDSGFLSAYDSALLTDDGDDDWDDGDAPDNDAAAAAAVGDFNWQVKPCNGNSSKDKESVNDRNGYSL